MKVLQNFSLPDRLTINPDDFDAVLFDMDGVVTRTATVHAAAWKQVFNELLRRQSTGRDYEPFEIQNEYVDGKARYEGVKSFLESRGIILPPGSPQDLPGFETMFAVGKLKDKKFLEQIHKLGVEVYESTVSLIQLVKERGMRTAVITASENATAILEAAKVDHLFDAKVDGLDAIRLHLKGKPQADMFLEAARNLGVSPARAIVVEDAAAGVEAGRNGGFGLTIGVDRGGNAQLLEQSGANVVLSDLSELSVEGDRSSNPPGKSFSDVQMSDDDWVLKYNKFEPEEEGRREALCALGNGYFTTRAASAESIADEIHYPGTYLAGGYNRLHTRAGDLVLEHEDLVNLPNWLPISFRIGDDPWFDLTQVEILIYEQSLNLLEGILHRRVTFRDKKQRETTLHEQRFVHMRHFHLAGLKIELIAVNWSAPVTIRSALDGRVINNGVRMYRSLESKHLCPLESRIDDDILLMRTQTSQSRLELCQAARTSVFKNGELSGSKRVNIIEKDSEHKNTYLAQDITIDLVSGDQVCIEKVVSLYTSRDSGISEPMEAANIAVRESPDFDTLAHEHIQAWRQLWQRFDLSIETKSDSDSMRTSLILHLHSFHVLQTVSPNSVDFDAGIPARGWTGEAYKGHVFWDELFVFPFLNLHMPEISRALLRYRFRRLDEARKLAKELGANGARYPWESGSSGREETPRIYFSETRQEWLPEHTYRQVHVNAAIAYNIWHYWQVSSDLEFLSDCGAEMLLEIARFFASFAKYNPERDRYEIHGVVGPDEYHSGYPDSVVPGINNNAYTNLTAVWTLCRALELLQMLPTDRREQICSRIELTNDEISLWDSTSRKMFIPMREDGIIYQFDGYEKLDDFPWKKNGALDIDRVHDLLNS